MPRPPRGYFLALPFAGAAFLRATATFFFVAAFLRAGAALGGLSIPVFTAILPSALPII